jgi:hypothetical protein
LLYPFIIQRCIKKCSELTCSGTAVNALYNLAVVSMTT